MISLTNALPGAQAVQSKPFGMGRRKATPRTSRAGYRCSECAEVVAFNSLAISCLCIRECYRDVGSRPVRDVEPSRVPT